jgi:hypothetical protein
VDTLESDIHDTLPADPKVPSSNDAEDRVNELALKENRMAMSLLNTTWELLVITRFITETFTQEYRRGFGWLVWKGSSSKPMATTSAGLL